jgi:hypothetical protein
MVCPTHALNLEDDGYHYFPKNRIVKVYVLQSDIKKIPQEKLENLSFKLSKRLSALCLSNLDLVNKPSSPSPKGASEQGNRNKNVVGFSDGSRTSSSSSSSSSPTSTAASTGSSSHIYSAVPEESDRCSDIDENGPFRTKLSQKFE